MPITSIFSFSHSVSNSLYHTIPTFKDPEKKALENIVERRENAGNQHFPTMFSTLSKKI